MELSNKVVSMAKLLAGFNIFSETNKGKVQLITITVGVINLTHFNILYGNIRYNVILGKSLIHSIGAVTLT